MILRKILSNFFGHPKYLQSFASKIFLTVCKNIPSIAVSVQYLKLTKTIQKYLISGKHSSI